MSTTEIITAIIAIYGATLATFTFGFQRLEKQKKVVVKLQLGFMGDGQSTFDIVSFDAANAGQVPVHVSSCRLLFPETKEQFVAPFRFDKDLPITLNPGEAIQGWIESEKFIKVVRKNKTIDEILVLAEFSNKGGGKFFSKTERFNLNTMLYAKQNLI